jgi:hypothetical protein
MILPRLSFLIHSPQWRHFFTPGAISPPQYGQRVAVGAGLLITGRSCSLVSGCGSAAASPTVKSLQQFSHVATAPIAESSSS